MTQGHKETFQDLADRYCQFGKEFPIIEKITDRRLRAKLHQIHCEKFIDAYKGKHSKPSHWEVLGAREYNPDEILDYGNDLLLMIEIMELHGGKIHVSDRRRQEIIMR